MKTNKSFLFGLVGFGTVLTVSFILNGVLGLAGFENTYRNSLVSQYSIQGEAVKGKIEQALDLGKQLSLLDGQVEQFFYDAIRQAPGIQHFYVADATGSILYTTRTVLNQTKVPFEYTRGLDRELGDKSSQVETIKFLDAYYIAMPLYAEDTKFQGTIFVEFSEKAVSSYIYRKAEGVIWMSVIILIITMILYGVFSYLFRDKKRGETIVTVVLLLASQGLFTTWNFDGFNTSITQVFGKNMSVLARSIAEDFQKTLDWGMGIESLGKTPEYLQQRLAGTPQASDVFVTDASLNIIHSAHIKPTDTTFIKLGRQDTELTMVPLSSPTGNGFLVLRINRPLINGIIQDMAMDAATVIVVALIFAFIIKDFFTLLSGIKTLKLRLPEDEKENAQNSLRLIKISTFLFMFAAFETLSFFPLYIQEILRSTTLDGRWMGLDPNTAISIPIGSYMLGVVLAMLLSLFVLKKMSIRTRYMIMTTVFIAGSILSMGSPSMMFLTLARLIAGFGFGGVLMGTTSLVIAYTTDQSRSAGFGTNAAAFAAATICAIPIGGVTVNKFGYETGIWVSILFAGLFLLFVIFGLYNPSKDEADHEEEKPQPMLPMEGIKMGDFLKTLFSRHIIVYVLLINIPFQLVYVGLFQFSLPLWMSDTLMLSQGNIGRILSIFSIVSLGAAWVSRASDRIKNDTLLLAIGALCVGLMLVIFPLVPGAGLVLFIGVMVAMGIDNVFIDAIEEVYVSSGNIPGIGEEDLLQSYKTIEKVISVVIPTLSGVIIMSLGFTGSLLAIGLYTLVGALAFPFLGKNGRWTKAPPPLPEGPTRPQSIGEAGHDDN